MTREKLQTLDRTASSTGLKPSLCLIPQRKHQPADYLVFALSTNTMQKETFGLSEQLFCGFFSFLLFTALFFVFVFFCHTHKDIGRGCLVALGKGELKTKLSSENKVNPIDDFNYVFG